MKTAGFSVKRQKTHDQLVLIVFGGHNFFGEYCFAIQVAIICIPTYTNIPTGFCNVCMVLDCVSQLYDYSIVHFVRSSDSLFQRHITPMYLQVLYISMTFYKMYLHNASVSSIIIRVDANQKTFQAEVFCVASI